MFQESLVIIVVGIVVFLARNFLVRQERQEKLSEEQIEIKARIVSESPSSTGEKNDISQLDKPTSESTLNR